MAALTLTLGLSASLVPAGSASAVDIISQGCKGNGSSTVCQSKDDNATSMIKIVINTLFLVLGMVAVVMVVVGGFRYVTSGGDAGDVKAAKETILYSVVGLIIAILSYTIVNFVLKWF